MTRDDARTYLLLRSIMKVNIPEYGGEVEQTAEFSDYRGVDGVKVPFQIRVSRSARTYSISISKVGHSTRIDDASFSRPSEK